MTTSIPFPKVRQDYYPLGGGLDLVTPAITIEPGKVIDSQNYEPAIGGGYRRIDGYERYDGRSAPTGSPYWILPVNVTTAVAIGSSIIGLTSSATAVVLAIFPTYFVAGRVTGLFVAGETYTYLAANKGTITSSQQQNGATLPSDHADYLLLAANDTRQLIAAVPGSGPIRGAWIYNDVVYAFRDNAAGTAGAMYKATNSGWTQIALGFEMQFTAGTAPILVGDVLGNLGTAPTATVTVLAVLLRTGAFTGTAVGALIVAQTTGSFVASSIFKGATQVATTSTGTTAITRAPGGRGEFFNYNFSGSTLTTKMYGADGVNLAFEYDGTNYVPIRTGMTTDAPNHVIAHKGYLFLSFLASVQYSGLGAPYSWTVVLGAGELDVSRTVSGFLPQGGNIAGSSLGIFTAERTFILYGTSNTDFKLVSSIFDVGYLPYTLQQVSNNAYGMTSRGIQALLTTLNYGDFDYASVSHMIQPLITKKRGLEVSSVSLRNKNQFRIFYTDGTALTVGLTGDKESGILALNYNRPVRCVVGATLSTGQEVCYFGSDDGFIYQDNVGTSQDGATIEAWCRLPFNSDKSPLVRKRFRRAVFEVAVEGFSRVNITYDLGYANPLVQPAAPTPDIALAGNGGYWDQFVWDSFTWDAQYVANPVLSIDGTERNIGLLFYSNRAQDQAHVLQGVTLLSTARILSRA